MSHRIAHLYRRPWSGEVSAGGSVGRTICVNTHPPATDCRFPWAGSKRIAIKECSPAELLDDPVVGLVTMSDGVDRPTLELLLETVGRTVLSGAGAECAHKGSLRGPGDARLETKPRVGGGYVVTTIDFRTDPVTARRYRVVSLITHADIPDIVWADDETGCYGVRGRDVKGNRIVVEQSGPIRIVSARR
jgi:hypothetical protein